jgi:hypothetical protein
VTRHRLGSASPARATRPPPTSPTPTFRFGFDTRVSIAHNKVMVIDGATVITGSFNFTAAAHARDQGKRARRCSIGAVVCEPRARSRLATMSVSSGRWCTPKGN